MRGRGLGEDRRQRELESWAAEEERSRSRHERRWLKSTPPPPLHQQDPRASDVARVTSASRGSSAVAGERVDLDFVRSFDLWWEGLQRSPAPPRSPAVALETAPARTQSDARRPDAAPRAPRWPSSDREGESLTPARVPQSPDILGTPQRLASARRTSPVAKLMLSPALESRQTRSGLPPRRDATRSPYTTGGDPPPRVDSKFRDVKAAYEKAEKAAYAEKEAAREREAAAREKEAAAREKEAVHAAQAAAVREERAREQQARALREERYAYATHQRQALDELARAYAQDEADISGRLAAAQTDQWKNFFAEYNSKAAARHEREAKAPAPAPKESEPRPWRTSLRDAKSPPASTRRAADLAVRSPELLKHSHAPKSDRRKALSPGASSRQSPEYHSKRDHGGSASAASSARTHERTSQYSHAREPAGSSLSGRERRARREVVGAEARRSASTGDKPAAVAKPSVPSSATASTYAGLTPRDRGGSREPRSETYWAHRPSELAQRKELAYHRKAHAEPKALGQELQPKEEEKAKPKRSRDEIQHFDWHPGQTLGGYTVHRLLGDGTFGRVLEATAPGSGGRRVAVKVIRDVKKYVEAAKIEAQVLKRMQALGADFGVVQLLDTFQEGSLFCLAFEPLGSSLYDLLKSNKYRGFFMADVQKFVMQIMRALAAIHKIRLTHTDLKPENVLLVDPHTHVVEWPRGKAGEKVRRPVDPQVKLIDFGGSTFASDHHSSIINTRQYRAPEVTLGVGWEESSDLWSAGCLAAELYTGRMLFPTHDNLEHLAMMEATIGPMPRWMCERAAHGAERYVEGDRLRWPGDASSDALRAVGSCRKVTDYFGRRHAAFGEYLQYVLRLCPRTRPSARSAAKHEFFSMQLPE